jgi:hypothetical protein
MALSPYRRTYGGTRTHAWIQQENRGPYVTTADGVNEIRTCGEQGGVARN